MIDLSASYGLSVREARTHAVILAIVMWSVAGAVWLLGTDYRDANGKLKGTDFIHFYASGHILRTGPARDLIDVDAVYERQVALVPASAGDRFASHYPLHMYFVFAPLTLVPYLTAWGLWTALTALIYAGTLWLAWRPWRHLVPGTAVVAAGAAFPPFFYLVLHGQSTPLVIAAFSGAAAALAAGRPVLAGLAFGLLFLKPQFGLMLAVVVLAGGEWLVLGGLLLAAAAQLLLLVAALGPQLVIDSFASLARLAALQQVLEPIPAQVHSVAALTHLLPGRVDFPVWVLLCGAIAVLTLRVWRRSDLPAAVRVGALAIASVLVNPHLVVYDAAVLAVPFLSIGAWLSADPLRLRALGRRWWSMVYLLYPMLLVPTALFLRVQVSVLILAWMVYALGRPAVVGAPAAPGAPQG